jgi:sugar O-acyltransferase (sialic acid O-acetyltransferase NeuD family)
MMIRDLAIYGAGGFGREMALMVAQINAVPRQWQVIGFFDDGKKAGEMVDGLQVLGGIDTLNKWDKPLAVVIALADSPVRKAVIEKITNKSIEFPVLIHPMSLAGSAGNKFGKGTIITAGCILTTGIELKDFVVINLSTTIGHDVTIGSYTSVMPGCNISGGVTIGEGNLIGTGVKILQYLSIGNNCKIGAGAVVTKPVLSGKTVIGIPAKEEEKR